MTNWAPTEGLSAETLHKAVEEVRNSTYAPSCGTADRPHVFHPLGHARLLPQNEWPTGYFQATEWAFCANCGAPFPMRSKDDSCSE